MKIKNIVAMLPSELREIYTQVFDQNFTGGYTMLEYVNKMLEFNILVFDYIKTLPNLNVGPQGPQGEQGPQGPQGPKGDKGSNGSGFGDSYGKGEPWALPTHNQTFKYYITTVENAYFDDGWIDGTLMKNSYAPSLLIDVSLGDTIFVSKGEGVDYFITHLMSNGIVSGHTYTPPQGEDQLALGSERLKAVRIL